MLKNRSGATSWAIQHVGTTLGQGLLKLNNNNAVATNVAYPVWMSTAPTSSVFSDGTSSDTNGKGNDQVAYCFLLVESYSGFCSFEGNGQNEGPFVYTGFKPAFLLVKSADTTYDWFIYDTARQSYNEQGPDLRANRNYAEQNNTRFDFLSNGFKVHTSSVANNANAVTYIYAAFAEHPFKTARAR